jgi:DNA replication protein DnaC
VGEERSTDWAVDLLVGVLMRRYAAKRQTVITSNFKPTALIKSLGEPVVSRISELAGPRYTVDCSAMTLLRKGPERTDALTALPPRERGARGAA